MQARTFSRFIGKYLPGNPKIIIRIMTAGAGMVAPNYVYEVAKPDGLTLLYGSATTWGQNFLRPKGAKFKLEEMPGVFAFPGSSVFMSVPKVAREPLDLMTAKGLIMGHADPTSGGGLKILLMADLLDLPVEKWVWGYKGSSEVVLAALSGELTFANASVESYIAQYKAYEETDELVGILQSGVFDAKGNEVNFDHWFSENNSLKFRE